MNKWYKFWKKGGANNQLVAEDYFEYSDDYSHNDVRSMCEEWAEEVSYNHSFSYGFQEVDLPPIDWISDKISSNNWTINNLKKENKKLNDILIIYSRKDKLLKLIDNGK